MWTESKVLKVTRNGVVEDVNVTIMFEKTGENTPPLFVQMNMAGDRLKFHASVNYHVANKDMSFHVSDFQFAQTVFDIAAGIVEELVQEFDGKEE